MPAESNPNPAKTPIFTFFLPNSRLKYVQITRERNAVLAKKTGARPRFVLFLAGISRLARLLLLKQLLFAVA